jgi:hypothetical protein
MGYWRTDAPLSPKTMDEHTAVLMELLHALESVPTDRVVLREMRVWVSGVEWEYQYMPTVGGDV